MTHQHPSHIWQDGNSARLESLVLADILDTPAIVPQNDGVVITSVVGTNDVLSFLMAVKTFWHQLQRGRIAVLDDGSLTGDDKAVLARHCGDPEIIALDSIETDPFPATRDWAMLLSTLDRRKREYCIQLDTRSLALGPLDDIADAIARNRSFAVPDSEQRIQPTEGVSGYAVMGPDRRFAAAALRESAKLAKAVKHQTDNSAQILAQIIFANEVEPVLLLREKYWTPTNRSLPNGVSLVSTQLNTATCEISREMAFKAAISLLRNTSEPGA